MLSDSPHELSKELNSAETAWVRNCVKSTMKKLGYTEIGNEIPIEWEKMVKNVAMAKWTVHKDTSTGEKLFVSNFKLVFSETLWPYIPKSEKYETVVHECCHIIDAIENYNEHDQQDDHGKHWHKLMRMMGRKPDRKVNLEQLTIPREVELKLFRRCRQCDHIGHNESECIADEINKLFE